VGGTFRGHRTTRYRRRRSELRMPFGVNPG
jgi:hypothetical protein